MMVTKAVSLKQDFLCELRWLIAQENVTVYLMQMSATCKNLLHYIWLSLFLKAKNKANPIAGHGGL
jgi:hypothetical protein